MAAEDNENMVLRTVYLPKALDVKLRGMAFTMNVSKAEFMRTLLKEALDLREAKGERALAQSDRKVAITAKSPIKRTRVSASKAAPPQAKLEAAKPAKPKAAAPAPERVREFA